MKYLIILIILLIPLVNAHTINYYHNDHLGSTAIITNEDSNTIQEIQYDLFGQPLSLTNTPGYNQKEHDKTGIIYYEARYMDPEIGRFLTSDTHKKFPNSYIYTSNNPLNKIDPDGNIDKGIKENLVINSRRRLMKIFQTKFIEENRAYLIRANPSVFKIIDHEDGGVTTVIKGSKDYYFPLLRTQSEIYNNLYSIKTNLEMQKGKNYNNLLIQFMHGIEEKEKYVGVLADSTFFEADTQKKMNQLNFYPKKVFQKVMEKLPVKNVLNKEGIFWIIACGTNSLLDGQKLANIYQRKVMLAQDEVSIGYSKALNGQIVFISNFQEYKPNQEAP